MPTLAVEEIIGITRTKDDDPTKVIYLKIKAFIPSDQNIESKIEDFENGQIIMVKGKFIRCDGWYTPLPILDFNNMSSIGLNVTLVGLTTKTVMNINGYSVLNFYVEENLGNHQPNEFWVEVRHDPI
ncbi:hypothetical protein C1646_772556 [Rhizophagus diaphanus]|nr:hypothetical protein C1646_772556 [Rhizophagus diaphanus] [Rhizophagus sp. MUCL 43196]